MKIKKLLLATLVAVSLTACGENSAESTSQSGVSAGIAPPSCTASFADQQNFSGAVLDSETKHQRFIVKAGTRALSALRVMSAFDRDAKVDAVNSDYISVEFDHELSSKEAAERLRGEEFEYIEPDYTVTRSFAPNDPSIATQWAHDMVRSREAWDLGRGNNVVVAVLDSGVDYTHPDLAPNMWRNPNERSNGADNDGNGFASDIYGWDFFNNDATPMADDSPTYHGTHVAGTIGASADNGVGIAGHAPNVKIMALKFLGAGGSGATSSAIRAIDYAVKMKAHIINNSWGGSTYSQALSDAIERARQAGILFVAAAGNNGKNNDATSFYPANYPHDNIIRVAASDSSDRVTSWSNYGVKKVDLAAPGASIYSTKNGSTYQSLSGTSMATPLVAGVLATMVAARPDLPYWQHKHALLQSVDVVPAMATKVRTSGRVNALKALRDVMGMPPSNPSTPAPPPC